MAEISYDKIREVTGFNSSYIKLVNEHLRRTKLIYIKYGEFTENNMRDCNKYKTLSGNEYLKMPYKEYLQTEHWINLREQALRKAKYKCELCNSKENLNVHHKTYDNKGNEPLSDLIVLCNNCHAKFHNKVINLS
jgi:5-methylcytosine-specific restriction endonuclease McrA